MTLSKTAELCYSEYHLCWVLLVVNVSYKLLMLRVIMLIVVMLRVVMLSYLWHSYRTLGS
jgi:hypothetical protein